MRIPLSALAAFLAATGGYGTCCAVAAQAQFDPGQIQRMTRDAIRGALRSYQVRGGPEETERFTRRVKLGRDGRFSLTNVSGDISITTGAGDEVSIEAVKRVRGDRSQLAAVHIDVSERPGRVDVETRFGNRFGNRFANRVSVDYTVTVPTSAAVEVKSVSGGVKVTGVRGAVRAEAVSGDLTIADTPTLEVAKVVSGDVTLTNVGSDAELQAASVSGSVHAKGVKAHGLDLAAISGDLIVTDVISDRLSMRSVSGDLEYTGALTKNGRYDINAHSGAVHVTVTGDTGFDLTANTFSGTLRSDVPATVTNTQERDTPPPPPPPPAGGRGHPVPPGRPGRVGSLHATFGDGSAQLQIRTFSGDVTVTKK